MVNCKGCTQHKTEETPFGKKAELCKLQKTGKLDIKAMKSKDCENFAPIKKKKETKKMRSMRKAITKEYTKVLQEKIASVQKQMERKWASITFIVSVWSIAFCVPAIFILPTSLIIIPILLELLLLMLAIHALRTYRQDHRRRKHKK